MPQIINVSYPSVEVYKCLLLFCLVCIPTNIKYICGYNVDCSINILIIQIWVAIEGIGATELISLSGSMMKEYKW